MSDQPVTVEIQAPETAAMSVDITYLPSMTVEAGEVVLPAVSGGGMTLELVYGGIKGDRGDPGGVAVTRITAEAVGGHRVVVQDSGGKVRYASSDDPSHAGRVLGITYHAAGSGAEVLVQTVDVMDEGSWSWVAGSPVFLGLNGLMTQDVDQAGVFVLVLGVAVSATSFFINKQIAIFR